MAMSWSCLKRAGAALALALALPAHAVEYTLDGNLAMGQQYNSNIQLQPQAQQVWGGNLDLGGSFKAREANWEVAAAPRLTNYLYEPASDLQFQNQYVDLDGHYQGERLGYQFATQYIDDYILSSQSDQIVGLVLGKVHRRIVGAAPGWTYGFGETLRGRLGYNYSRAEYGADNYPDSETHAVSGALELKYSERLGFNATLSYTHYDADQSARGFRNTIEYANAGLGVDYSFDETLKVRFSAGGQYNRTQPEYQGYAIQGYVLVDNNPPTYAPVLAPARIRPPAQDSAGAVFDLDISKRVQDSDWNLSYSRQISPSINGALLEYDRVGLNGLWRLREDLDGRLELGYTHQAYSDGLNGAIAYYQAGSSLSYRWSPHWSASTGYHYLLRVLDQGGEQDAHSVSLTLRYDFDTHTF